MMLEKMNSAYNEIYSIVQGNQILAAGLGVYGLGIITYLLKDVPLRIINFIKKQTTTTLTINNHDPVFYDFLKWVDDKTITGLVRNWNFNNGKSNVYYIRNSPKMTVGYGRTYSFWNKKLLIMDRIKIDASQTTESKEIITITSFGRNKDIFSRVFKEIERFNEVIIDDSLTTIHVFKKDYWIKSCKITKRSMDSVILPHASKKEIIDHIDNFSNNKKWYEKNGVPYRTGILLEGPPGTGKTSMVRALASHLNKDLYYIDATECHPSTIKEALIQVPVNSLIVIEEIDRMFVNPMKNCEDDEKQVSGAALLNALDGIVGSENRILIATTNHIEKLDAALIREGRFDIKIHVGFMTDESFRTYIERMYPDFKETYKYSIKSGVAPCLVQKLVFDNKNNIYGVLEQVCETRTDYSAYNQKSMES